MSSDTAHKDGHRETDRNWLARHRSLLETLSPWAVGVAVILLWQLITGVAGIKSYVLPSPYEILIYISHNYSSLLSATGGTAIEIAIGYVVASIFATVVALLFAMVPPLERAFMPLFVTSQAVPIIVIAPLFLIWIGVGAQTKIVLVGLSTFFPVLINMLAGLRSADSSLLMLFQSVGASRRQEIFKLRLPYSVPYLFAGLKVATVLAVIGAIIAEWVASSSGLGYQILVGSSNLETTLVFSALIFLVCLSLLFYRLISVLESLFSWKEGNPVTTAR